MKYTRSPVSCESSPQDKPLQRTGSNSLMSLLSMPLQQVVDPHDAGVDFASCSALKYPGPLYCPSNEAVGNGLFCNIVPESPVSDIADASIQLPAAGLCFDEFEPTPIHPGFSHSHLNEMMVQVPPPPPPETPLTASALSLVNCALDHFNAQPGEHNHNVESSNLPKKQEKQEPILSCVATKHPLVVAPTDASASANTRPIKRACIRKVSISSTSTTNDENHTPRFRNYQEKQWKELFDQLVKFKDAKGHCLVPHTFPENAPLSRWVKRQRYQYKLRNENMLSTMTQARIEMLESVGFVWDSHAVAWEEHRLELVEYKKSFGHCDVPSSYKNSSLATWVKRQRRQKKLFWSNQKSTMTMERFTLLENMGFSWEITKNNNSNKSK